MKQHGHKRRGEHERGCYLGAAHAGFMADALPLGTIPHLIVVLYKPDESMPRQADNLAAVVSSTIFRIISVIDKHAAQRLGQLGKGTKVRVVASTLAGDDSEQGVVKVVAPLGVETVSAGLLGLYYPGIVQITFGDQVEVLSHRCFESSYFTGKLLQKVNRRAVIESVHRVQAQSIHVVIGAATSMHCRSGSGELRSRRLLRN